MSALIAVLAFQNALSTQSLQTPMFQKKKSIGLSETPLNPSTLKSQKAIHRSSQIEG